VSDRLVLLRAGRLVDDRPTPAAAEIGLLLDALAGTDRPVRPDGPPALSGWDGRVGGRL
jgi:hypothetical protein